MNANTSDSYDSAIVEISEQADYRENGPKWQSKCPDCGSTLDINKTGNGRYNLTLVKHQI